VDGRTDVWALGVVLYEMITGHLPFEADHREAIGFRIQHDEPEPLAKHRGDIPKGLQGIIDRALHKDRAHRYHKVSQMKADMERVLRGRQPHPVLKRALIITAGALVIGMASWKIADWITPDVPADKRILVMPFTSAGLDPLDQSTYAGVRQTLTGGLKRLERYDRSFWIVPPIEISRRSLDDVSDASGIFGVNLLVSGRVHHASDDYVIELSLVDAESHSELRTAEIVYPPEQVTDLQHALLSNVADMIGLRLPAGALREVTNGGTELVAAYESFLQGHGYLAEGDSVAVATAVERFERATEIDSNYARAYCGLAEACWQNYATTDDSVWVQRAEDSCRRALAIDDGLPRAYVTLGVLCTRRSPHEEAIGQFRAALDINPVCWAAYNGLAQVYKSLGQHDQAVAAFERAIDLRPDYWPIQQDLGYFYYPLGRYEDAAEVFEGLVEKTPGHYMTHNTLGAFYYLLGRMDDAEVQFKTSFSIKKNPLACQNLGLIYHRKERYAEAASMYQWAVEFERGSREHLAWGNLAKACAMVDSLSHKADENYRKAIELAEADRARNPNDAVVTAFLAGYYLDVDDEAKSRERIGQALKLAPKNSEVLFRCGHAYERLGEREKALTYIGKAIEHGYSVDEIQQDDDLKALRRDPRFELLLPNKGSD
jgi:tetratricopeptide (TPR) repeat protein